MADPLTSITHQLASSTPGPSSQASRPKPDSRATPNGQPSELQARLARESSERERARNLIRRKKREMEGNETPVTPHGSGYSNLYNRKEVEEAHRGREHRSNWIRKGGGGEGQDGSMRERGPWERW